MGVAGCALLHVSLCPPVLWLWYQLRSKGLGLAHQMGVIGNRIRLIPCQQTQGRADTSNACVEIISSEDVDSTLQI